MVISFKDIPLWSNVLSKNNLTPWFEKIATFFMALMLISSFFILYGIRFSASIHCIPETGFAHNLTTSDIAFVNEVCYNEWGNILQYSDVVVFGFFTLIFVSRSWWLLSSRVVNCFNTVTELDGNLRKLDEDPEELKKMITESIGPNLDEKTRVAVRSARQYLFTSHYKDSCISTIAGIYALRNATVIFCSTTSIVIIVICLIPPAFADVAFDCASELFANTAYSNFKCTQHISKLVQIHFIIFCAGAGFLTIIAGGCIVKFFPLRHNFEQKCLNRYSLPKPTAEFESAMYNTRLISVFSRRSQPFCEATNTLLMTKAGYWLKEVKDGHEQNPDDKELERLHKTVVYTKPKSRGSQSDQGNNSSQSLTEDTPLRDASDEIAKICKTAKKKGWYEVFIAAHLSDSERARKWQDFARCECNNIKPEQLEAASNKLMDYVLTIKEKVLQKTTSSQILHGPVGRDAVSIRVSAVMSQLSRDMKGLTEAVEKSRLDTEVSQLSCDMKGFAEAVCKSRPYTAVADRTSDESVERALSQLSHDISEKVDKSRLDTVVSQLSRDIQVLAERVNKSHPAEVFAVQDTKMGVRAKVGNMLKRVKAKETKT